MISKKVFYVLVIGLGISTASKTHAMTRQGAFKTFAMLAGTGGVLAALKAAEDKQNDPQDIKKMQRFGVFVSGVAVSNVTRLDPYNHIALGALLTKGTEGNNQLKRIAWTVAAYAGMKLCGQLLNYASMADDTYARTRLGQKFFTQQGNY